MHERRDGTATWKVEIGRSIEKGEKLKGLDSFSGFKDIVNYRKQISDWQEDTAYVLGTIYKDSDAAKGHCPPIEGFDVGGVSHHEAIQKLKEFLEERINSLKGLIAE